MRRGKRTHAILAIAAVAAAAALAAVPHTPAAYAAPSYLYVSADDEAFGGTFAGSMVVEVVVRDPAIRSVGEPAGEPSVAVDGEPLRMVQGADGSWYAYFADLEAAIAADAAAVAAAGRGMDFGVFCAPNADEGVLGTSFEYADAVAVARAVSGGTDGNAGQPSECGDPIGGEMLNSVVRRAPRVSNADGPSPGQIGINPDAWPIVQLYSLGRSVDVEYRGTGGTELVRLMYDEIPNAAMSLERDRYPAGAEVYVTIRDAQLNQDPTDRDVWTFSTDPDSPAVFYMGGWDGKDAPPAVDLHPHLRAIGFEENGALTIDAGRTVAFKPNGLQSASVIQAIGGGGGAYSSLVTVRETGASTSEFASYDGDGASTVWVPRDAPRGTAAVFEYNDARMSALTGPSTATVGIGGAPPAAGGGGGGSERPAAPGTLNTVTIIDADRNANPSKRDVLSASSADPVPSVRMGAPLTVDGTGGAWWWAGKAAGGEDGRLVPAAYSAIDSGRIAVGVPDTVAAGSATLIIDAGYDGGDIRRLLGGPSARSTMWLNYDVRSLAGPNGQDGATIGIVFGGVDAAGAMKPPAAEVWDVSDGQGTVRATGNHGNMRGPVAFVVELPGGVAAGAAPAAMAGTGSGSSSAVIHIDLFSFGTGGIGGNVVNNALYRLELEETGPNTGIFDGTIEYVVLDGRNGADATLAASLVAYGEDARIGVVGGGLGRTGDDTVTVSYMDIGAAGGDGRAVAAGTGVRSHAGSVHFGDASYGIGRPVTLTLIDPDLNTDHARVETFNVVDDAASPHVDAVASGGSILLEITIKGERYSRCTIDGVEYGGLASTGFALVETGPATGVFEGSFKLPTKVCSADGVSLVSPAGGRIDVRYYDYAYGGGDPVVVGTSPYGAPRPADTTGADGDRWPVGGGARGGSGSGSTAPTGGGVQTGGGWTGPICPECWEERVESEGDGRQHRLQIPADARQTAMAKGERMSDAELYRVVHSAAKAAGGGGWNNQDLDGKAAPPPAAPSWYKTVAGWWGDGRLSDAEFAVSARYVLDYGLVRLP